MEQILTGFYTYLLCFASTPDSPSFRSSFRIAMKRALLFSTILFCTIVLFSCTGDENKPAGSVQQRTSEAKTPAKRSGVSLVERAEARETVPALDNATAEETGTVVATDLGEKIEVQQVQEVKSFEGEIKGRSINIAVTGVDSRIGDNTPHADANHVISIYPDSGRIIITSVPRDTYADAGFEADSMQRFNILANVLPNRSRKSYHKELARIAGVPKIDYYVEVGFSQAMGVMELLGYKNPKNTLRVLRSRKGLGGDDYQRSYNQGQFIRQAILRHFGKLDGFLGGLLVRGGLLLLETDLTAEKSNAIIEALAKHDFPRSGDDVAVRMRPVMRQKFAVYNFGDESTIDSLDRKLNRFNKYMSKKDSGFSLKGAIDVENRLNTMLTGVAKDTTARPRNVLQRLERPFEQRVWLQVSNPEARNAIRGRFAQYLSAAYRKLGKQDKAQHVLDVVRTEEELFKARQEQ